MGLGSPNDFAGFQNVLGANEQVEFARNADRTLDQQCSAALGEVLDGAIDDGAVVVEENLAALEGSPSLVMSLVHEAALSFWLGPSAPACREILAGMTWRRPLRDYTDS